MLKYLITGGAGFIGSRISELLIESKNHVKVLDNLSSGNIKNLDEIINHENFEFVQGDIRDFDLCKSLCEDVDIVIHQAAMVSVPKSIETPLDNNDINITGFLNILEAARLNNVKRVIYASSSAVYGDNEDLEKIEDKIGEVISPYALSKYSNELYAQLYSRLYDLETVGLRYFNVFGPKQDPSSVYSGVISIFMKNLLEGKEINIYGDGNVVRDFVHVDDVARANILASHANVESGPIYNIGTALPTRINDLAKLLISVVNKDVKINYLPPRQGDILYSCACIQKAKKELGFFPTIKIEDGLRKMFLELMK